MIIIDNVKYYTAKEVGMLVNRSQLTIHLWDTWSRELEKQNKERLIPKPIVIGKRYTRYWSEEQVQEIMKFAQSIKRGDLAEFTRKIWDTQYRHKIKKMKKCM